MLNFDGMMWRHAYAGLFAAGIGGLMLAMTKPTKRRLLFVAISLRILFIAVILTTCILFALSWRGHLNRNAAKPNANTGVQPIFGLVPENG